MGGTGGEEKGNAATLHQIVQARLPPISAARTPPTRKTSKLSMQHPPAPRRPSSLLKVQVELKKGETIMTDASLHLPAAFLHEAFSDRSGVPPSHFELYYRGKRLEGEAPLASWGVGKGSTIEVKMRGRGGGCVKSKESSAAAGRSAEQHPAGEVDRSTGAPKAVANRAAVEKAVAEQVMAKKATEEKTAGREAAVEKAAAETASLVAIVGAEKAGAAAADDLVPPAHDADLSKLLSKLLRHKAVELGVAIDADGWVALSDALAQINGPRLRELVGNAGKLGSHEYTEAHVREYTEADVRDVVDANDKRRFVINGTDIRAAQGHGMPGVGEKQGEPLTLETAPEVAVHGSYVQHVQAILEQGLSRMSRHHTHLAKGLLGEKGVISGMRSNAELFIWVNVHEAIKGGLTFYESANGVILCSGLNGDGVIPPVYFSIMIELHGGLSLEKAQASLAHRLARSKLYDVAISGLAHSRCR